MARLTGRVARSVFVGDHVEIVVEGAGGHVDRRDAVRRRRRPPDGAEVAALWRPEDTLRLPAGGRMKRGSRLPLLRCPAGGALAARRSIVWPMLGLFRIAFNEVGPTGAMVEAWSLEDLARRLRGSLHLRADLELASGCRSPRRLHRAAACPIRSRCSCSARESRFRGAARRDRRSCRCWSPAWCASSAGSPSSAIAAWSTRWRRCARADQRADAPGLQLDRRHHRPRREHHALHDPGAARGLRPARPRRSRKRRAASAPRRCAPSCA